ncbi:hypothetical protein [uncultured Sphingomonas sp.]|uniref:hypothetical protein n=1 Tax=uncultured Sphingomonas sp. TaxID=158754 RepID=UPI0025EC0C6C|nr:hypothetical protein [uncultured Sphingomonas sp.]
MTTNTTRRSLLRLGTGALAYGAGAAAVAGGLALAGEAKGAMPAVDRRAWDLAETTFNKARSELETFNDLHINPIVDHIPVGPARNAAINTIPDEVWEESGRLARLAMDAADALMRVPSPDHRAFASKFVIAYQDEQLDGRWGEELHAEALRFAREA